MVARGGAFGGVAGSSNALCAVKRDCVLASDRTLCRGRLVVSPPHRGPARAKGQVNDQRGRLLIAAFAKERSYFGSVDNRLIQSDFTSEQSRDFTVRKEIL
jgi:hypothetical protein